MKHTLFLIIFAVSLPTLAQDQKQSPTLKSILLQQLRSTHNEAEWFVPANTAVAALTAEQANWTDGKGNHSVGQLATHLIYWNRRNLARFKGEPQEKFSGNDGDIMSDWINETDTLFPLVRSLRASVRHNVAISDQPTPGDPITEVLLTKRHRGGKDGGEVLYANTG